MSSSAPTSLGEVLDAVDALLISAVPGLVTEFGEEFVHRGDKPPRVVWVPMPDEYERGQERHGTGPLPRSLGTCNAGVAAHCWAKRESGDTSKYADLTAAWNLGRRVLGACRKVMGASYSARAGQFLPANLTQLGRVYLVQLSFRLPVVEDFSWTTVQIVDPGPGVPGTSATITNTTLPNT